MKTLKAIIHEGKRYQLHGSSGISQNMTRCTTIQWWKKLGLLNSQSQEDHPPSTHNKDWSGTFRSTLLEACHVLVCSLT